LNAQEVKEAEANEQHQSIISVSDGPGGFSVIHPSLSLSGEERRT